MSINYVGSRTTHMPCCGYYNVAITPGPGTVASRAPYPYIRPTQYEQSNGSSTYDALQVQLQKRMSSGLAYTVNYTWSKTIDVACDGYFGAEDCFIRNPYNPAADRSVAGIDLPQMLTANVTVPVTVRKRRKDFKPAIASPMRLLAGGRSMRSRP